MAAVVGKVEQNLKDRGGSVKTTISREVQIGKTFISDVIALKPVKAVVDVVIDTLDNGGDGVKRQAEIARRWLSGLR